MAVARTALSPPREAARAGGDDLLPRARRAAFAGDAATAIDLYVAAISQGCASPAAFNDLGALMARRGQLLPALIQFEIAFGLDPSAHDIRANLCTALEGVARAALRENRAGDAAAAYTRLAQLAPDSASAQGNAGLVLLQTRSASRAVPFLRRAVQLQPTNAVAHVHLGAALYALNQLEAEAEFSTAITLDPANVDAHVNMAAVSNRLGRLHSATISLRRALQLMPDHAAAHASLAGVLREQGEVAACMEHYRRAIALRPDDAAIFSNYLLARQGDPTASPEDLSFDHRAWAARFAGNASADSQPRWQVTVDPSPQRRLRVGYVSGDLRKHAVASFIEPILTAHDRSEVHVTCYSDGPPDAVTARIQSVARPDAWRDIRELSDHDLAKRIAEDQIDILVDLAGHTAGNRLLTFAQRPAPIQVTYCGYPGSTGLSAMGWRLTDAIADPDGVADRLHSERLWRLPNGFLCFQPDPAFGAEAAAPCLARGTVTFGSFNNLSKLNDAVLASWAKILRGVEGSRLLLKARALSDQEPRQRLLEIFAEQGIEGARIAFAPYAANSQDHVALYGEVDVGLDPFPYNGTTTTCEALWMGVPVVTLAGKSHAGRVGASLLHRVGCPELVAESPESYVDAAIALGRDPRRLTAYRQELRPRMGGSPLTNAAVIARDIEAAYREMWRLWCAGAATG